MLAQGKVIPGNSDVLQVSYGDDTGLYVEFYWREVKNEQKSIEEGRPIFESKEYVKIMAAGDKTKTWDRPIQRVQNGLTPSDFDRFPKQWAAFQRQETQVTEGTPVTEWTQITRADAAMLKSLGFHTIELIANMGEHSMNWMGARKYKEMALAWIAKSKDNASAAQWAKEKADLQDQITALKNMINGLKEAGVLPEQEALAPPAPKKRGPKPKVNNEQDISGADPTNSG